jgi:hypothetical protein
MPRVELSPCEEAAVLVLSVSSELAAVIFEELEPQEVLSLTVAISQLPKIDPLFRPVLADRFLQEARAAGRGLDGLEKLGQRNLRHFVSIMRRFYLRGGVALPAWSGLALAQQAAAVWGSLPADGMARVGAYLEPDLRLALATLLKGLPSLKDNCVPSLRLRFLHHAHWLAHDHRELDHVSRCEPRRVAETFRLHYFGRRWQSQPVKETTLDDCHDRFVPKPEMREWLAAWKTPVFSNN